MVLKIYGLSICFAINALSFVPLVLCLVYLSAADDREATNRAATPRALKQKSTIRTRVSNTYKDFKAEFLESVAYINKTPRIKRILGLVNMGCLLGYVHIVLMPVFASSIFGGGPRILGILLSMIGLGAILGSFVLATRDSSQSLLKLSLVSCLGLATTLIIFSQSSTLTVGIPVLILSGFCMVNFMGSASSLIQCESAPKLRGRVVSFYTMAHAGLAPLGALLAGKAAEHWGVGAAVTVGSSLLFLYAARTLWLEVHRPQAEQAPIQLAQVHTIHPTTTIASDDNASVPRSA